MRAETVGLFYRTPQEKSESPPGLSKASWHVHRALAQDSARGAAKATSPGQEAPHWFHRDANLLISAFVLEMGATIMAIGSGGLTVEGTGEMECH